MFIVFLVLLFMIDFIFLYFCLALFCVDTSLYNSVTAVLLRLSATLQLLECEFPCWGNNKVLSSLFWCYCESVSQFSLCGLQEEVQWWRSVQQNHLTHQDLQEPPHHVSDPSLLLDHCYSSGPHVDYRPERRAAQDPDWHVLTLPAGSDCSDFG